MSSPTAVEGYAATDHSGSGAKSASVSLPSGATILIVSAARNDDAAGPISGVAYGGVALTQLPDSPQVYGAAGIGKCAMSMWELDDLTAVSGTTLAWTQSGPTTIQATFITSPAIRTDTAGNLWSQTGGNLTVNVVPVIEGIAIVACAQHDGFSNPIITPYGSQTQFSEDAIDNVQLNVSYLSGITGTQAVGGNFSGSLGSTFQPRVIAALYESGAPVIEPVVPGGRGRPGDATVATGPPMVKAFGPGGRGRPAAGVRVTAEGPATFLLNTPRRDHPRLVGWDGTGYVRGDGSPAQDGDYPAWHPSRPPTLEAPAGGGSLVVAEEDGDPEVEDVTRLEFDGAVVTDEGGGVALVTISAGAAALGDLTDVDTTGAGAGEALIYDGAEWVPGAVTGGIEVRDESDVESEDPASVLIFPDGTVVPHGDGSVSIREVPTGAVYAYVKHTTTQALTGTAENVMTFNTEVHDTDGLFATGTPTRFTIPAHLGGRAWMLVSHVFVSSAITHYHRFRLNGSTLLPTQEFATASQGFTLVHGPIVLQAGDYVERTVYAVSAGSAGDASSNEQRNDFGIYLLGTGNIAGFAKETIGRTTVGANFESSTARVCYKQVTVTKPGLITSIAAHVKGNGTNVGHLSVALYADNAGVPGALLAVGPAPAYVNGQYVLDIYKNTTAAWISRPLNAWVEAGTYWLAVYVGAPGAAASMQIAYDGTGDYHLSHPGWFPDTGLSGTPAAASRSYSINADIIYGGQGERGYRVVTKTTLPVGVPHGTRVTVSDVRHGMDFQYDSSLNRWLSVDEFPLPGMGDQAYAASFSMLVPIPHDYPIRLTRIDWGFYGSSESWSCKYQTATWNEVYTDVTGSTRSTASHTDARWYGYSDAISYAVDGTGGNVNGVPNILWFVATRSSGTTYISSVMHYRLSLAP